MLKRKHVETYSGPPCHSNKLPSASCPKGFCFFPAVSRPNALFGAPKRPPTGSAVHSASGSSRARPSTLGEGRYTGSKPVRWPSLRPRDALFRTCSCSGSSPHPGALPKKGRERVVRSKAANATEDAFTAVDGCETEGTRWRTVYSGFSEYEYEWVKAGPL